MGVCVYVSSVCLFLVSVHVCHSLDARFTRALTLSFLCYTIVEISALSLSLSLALSLNHYVGFIILVVEVHDEIIMNADVVSAK